MATIKDGIKGSKTRNRNVCWMNRINKKARALHTTGVLPQATYGMEGVGYSPDCVKAWRTMAADSMGCSERGRCPITAIAVAKSMDGDPYVRGPGLVMKQWATAYPQIEPKGLKQAWDTMVDQLEDPKGKPWARVKGPMGAVYMHLKEIGWHAACDEQHQLVGLKDQEGSLWKFNRAISWHDFEEEVAAIRIKQLCELASKHRGGQGMDQGID